MFLSAYDIECLQKAKTIIDKEISQHFSITEIAANSGIGSTKLKKGFKQQYGAGLFAYLRKQRMEMAAMLLISSDKSIKQIAKATGFHYTSNFNTAFTKYFKTSPARFRIFHRIK